ncbi:MAG: hypothetical protein LBI45_07725 [Bacteroidales bacterium]|jgi:mRNA interferase RelE/StbE|nr:hypothetical protein [Bacteroidales bacterium]
MIVFFSKTFEKSFDSLKDNNVKKRLQQVIDKLEIANSLADISNVISIKNYSNLYRIRIGKYRLLLSHERNSIEILLLDCLKRNENTYKFI